MQTDPATPPAPRDIHSGRLLATGEDIVWQGQPRFVAVFMRMLRAPFIAAYFVLTTLAGAAFAVMQRLSWSDALAPLLPGLLTLAAVAIGAAAIQRTTRYLITSRRVILRYGVVFPRSLSLPFSQIAAMAVTLRSDQHGDIALTLRAPNHMPFLKLWPHVRAWRLRHPEPMLRDVAMAGVVAPKLARLLSSQAPHAVGIAAQDDTDARTPASLRA